MNSSLVRYAGAFLLALVANSTVVYAIQIGNWRPDLVLIVLVMFALQHGKGLGSTAGFLVGVVSDLMSWKLLGVGALAKSLTGYLAGALARFFQERSQFIITLFISGFVHDVIYQYINTLGREINWKVLVFAQIIPNLLYSAIVGVVMYYFLAEWLTEDEQSQF